jgi:hypothetical protein
MIDVKYEAAIRRAFKELHGCDSEYSHTQPIKEMWKGQAVWDGDVEVFDLFGHPRKVVRGFAWAYDKGSGSEIVCVLDVPPVVSPQTAVQAAIVAQGKLRV